MACSKLEARGHLLHKTGTPPKQGVSGGSSLLGGLNKGTRRCFLWCLHASSSSALSFDRPLELQELQELGIGRMSGLHLGMDDPLP